MSSPQVVTRFAPSPTGYLHIGGARTALFNWLYARANGGKFLLRIEDTDRARSTPEATAALIQGLEWLGLDYDGEIHSQFARADRHRAVANDMLSTGHAYKCFSTSEEIEAYRAQARQDNNPLPFQSPWRDADVDTHPDAPFVIRLKSPREGGVAIKDRVQKKVSWAATTFDDLIMLRSDGTPTYMLAVVVDDHDMGVTHIIRGDDHLINAGRQSLIYRAMGWDIPEFAHIPLIHGEDGKKLSKRHGATGVHEYAALGYMPEAMRNYLARLGWSHGNDELFTTQQAIEWFDFKGMGKSPSRLDFKKLDNVSAHHIKTVDDSTLLRDLQAYASEINAPLSAQQMDDLGRALSICKEKSRKLGDILDKAQFILSGYPLEIDEKSADMLNSVSISILSELTARLNNVTWTADAIFETAKDLAADQGIKLGAIGMPLKAALSGRANSPSGFGMMEVLGRDESLKRIGKAVKSNEA
ncbi:glutamate--tRNA ligase 1 [Amylibacter marinus]|uniref:Glutamate--tRNA ligase n=1 Tax=Amylibacter marinus TaxID=1475483 RepID=A0ABQ5VSY2_9RHOB|nr:glutamate--tRNA ligase [Amylibacter marinus]GLQ34391.1 glutamate--tRNA ligase 1 [Amylibacter marinus]